MDSLISNGSALAGFLTTHWFTIAAATLVTVFLYFYGTREARRLKVAKAAFGDLQGPEPWPFLGNMPDIMKFKGQTHLQFDYYYQKYGRVFMYSMFGKCVLVVADPDMLKQILVKDFDTFYDRTNYMDLVDPLDKMLSTAKGSTWKRIRHTLSPTFSAHKMKLMVPLMNEACDTLVKKLSEMADTGRSFDIAKVHRCLTMDIILSTAFGVRSECQSNPDDPFMAKGKAAMEMSAFKKTIMFLLFMLPFSSKLFALLSGWVFSGIHDMCDIAKEMIALRRTDPGRKRMDMLELMLDAAGDPETHAKKLTDSEVVAQCIVFILAGYETTSTTLALTCYHLASNPDVQEKLQQEIDEVWTERDQVPSYDTVRELPYLDMVIAETLRLYPLGFMLSRNCMKDTVIKGVKIPNDTPILIPAYSIQRDPEFWPNPDKFDPERFSAEAKQSRDPYTYMPFGHGPHNCIGVRFAQMEMKLVLARILKKFSFELDPDVPGPPCVEMGTVLTVRKGVTVKIVSRK